MKNLHAKSPCCRGTIIHYGNRRRQCTQCGATWSIRPRKRGRKRHRIRSSLIDHVFTEKMTLSSLARRKNISEPAMARQFRRSLDWYAKCPNAVVASRARQYALIADALWFRFNKERWTLYLRALKPATRDTAAFLNPILLPGKESAQDWRRVIEEIPQPFLARVKAFVSDGFSGSKRIVQEYGWIFQRCHFHLIAQFQIRRGRRKTVIEGRQTREEVYQTVRKILVGKNCSRVKMLKKHLYALTRRRDCPRKLKSIAREFLRDVGHFRAYLNHPALNLPNTTNTVESINRIIRERCGSLRTPASLIRWANALLKHHSIFTCKRANYQQN